VRYRLALLLLALAVPAAAQDRGADMRTAFARVQHLKHGINASEWFAPTASDYSAAFTARYTMRRISRSWPSSDSTMSDSVSTRCRWSSSMNHGGSSNGDFFGPSRSRGRRYAASGLAVQIDIHPEEPYKQAVKNDNEAWSDSSCMARLAAHYSNRDPRKSSSRL